MELIYERSEIPNTLIKECEYLSIETGEIHFIFDNYLSSKIRSNYLETNEKRDLSIDSILSESPYHIGTIEDFKDMPSRFSYYDTETKESDRYKRYKIVENYIKSFGFLANEFNFGPEFEQSYSLYIQDENNLELLVVRISPNLMISIKDGYNENTLYTGFFSKSKINESITKVISSDVIRDFKIK